MKLPLVPARDSELPACFGLAWDPKEADCRRCLCFSPCGEKTARAKVDPPAAAAGEEALAKWPGHPQLAHSLGETGDDQPLGAPMPPVPLLSVPEVVSPDEPLLASLGREIIRGVGKAVGWTVANWFDRTPLTRVWKRK